MTSIEEEKAKRAVNGYTPPNTRQCGPDNLDQGPVRVPDADVAASYPSENPRYSYNYETPTHKIDLRYQDGHHPDDRWNRVDDQVGQGIQHIHDDLKRLPPTILQSDPDKAKLGFMGRYPVTDRNQDIYEQPGDKLGLSPEERTRKPKSRLDDGIAPNP